MGIALRIVNDIIAVSYGIFLGWYFTKNEYQKIESKLIYTINQLVKHIEELEG